jgi:hypothetical protein
MLCYSALSLVVCVNAGASADFSSMGAKAVALLAGAKKGTLSFSFLVHISFFVVRQVAA